jgi:hypothetical protein
MTPLPQDRALHLPQTRALHPAQTRVTHLRDGFIVAKVGIARQRDRFPFQVNA